MSVAGKIVVITGASSGIGKSIAEVSYTCFFIGVRTNEVVGAIE